MRIEIRHTEHLVLQAPEPQPEPIASDTGGGEGDAGLAAAGQGRATTARQRVRGALKRRYFDALLGENLLVVARSR